MNANLAIWLATIAIAIHFVLGALQSGSFNAILAKFSIPPCPPKAVPWLGLGLGLGSGIVLGVQSGDVLSVATAKAIAGMFAGTGAAFHLETVRGILPIPAPAGKSSGTTVLMGSEGRAASVRPPAPPAVTRRRTHSPLALALVAFAGLLFACLAACSSFWASAVPADIQKNEECVAGQIEIGNLDPVAIEGVCLPGQLATVVDTIDYLFTSPAFSAKHAAVKPTLDANVKMARTAIAAGHAK